MKLTGSKRHNHERRLESECGIRYLRMGVEGRATCYHFAVYLENDNNSTILDTNGGGCLLLDKIHIYPL